MDPKQVGYSVNQMATKIANKKIFITGGAGFIGSTLIGRLIEDNEITVFDNMTRDALSKQPYSSHKNLTVIRGSVLDYQSLKEAMKGAELICHCAGVAGIDTVIKKPTLTMQVNMVGSANVLEAASQTPTCQRVVCFSTSEVFGSHAFSSSETDKTVIGAVGEARWTYAVSKLAEEHLAIAYYHERNLATSVVRPFNVYGPGQVGEGALRAFVKRAIAGEPLEIHGDGTQIRAWCFVDDMVEGTLLALSHPKAIGESFNIGNQRSVETIFGLANTVVRVLNSKSEIRFIRKDYVDIELRIPNTTKAKELLGFEAQVGLEKGISRTADFYRTH